jgi:hypothetical protein
MANSCDNRLVVSGEPARLVAFRDALAGGGTVLDFERRGAPPADATPAERMAWCRHHWGTDRNAHEARLLECRPEQRLLLYGFETAWTAPVTFVEALATEYPDLDIILVADVADAATVAKWHWCGGHEVEACEVDRGLAHFAFLQQLGRPGAPTT